MVVVVVVVVVSLLLFLLLLLATFVVVPGSSHAHLRCSCELAGLHILPHRFDEVLGCIAFEEGVNLECNIGVFFCVRSDCWDFVLMLEMP